MHIFEKVDAFRHFIHQSLQPGATLGLVPTMGALHAGHRSLLDAACRQTDLAVCSIFVNPTQFTDPADFLNYPSTPGQDLALLEASGISAALLPSLDQIYPAGTGQLPHWDLGDLENRLEGKFRPGHFQGVAQVVHRLLEIVRPDRLFMGLKDYQQCLIVERLIGISGLETRLVPCPIIREPDGLAMSSRNLRLSEAERKKAPALYRALKEIGDHWQEIPFREWTHRTLRSLEQKGFRVDYAVVSEGQNLQEIDLPLAGTMVALIAASLNGIRLIDNIQLR